MAMVPRRSLPKLGAYEAMKKCLWFISMKFGDNDNAMGGMVDCKSLYHQTTSSEPISSMAMVPSRSLPKVGAFEAMEKCLWSISMKFGDNNNAMLVLSIASPSTAKPQVQSLYHPWLWSPPRTSSEPMASMAMVFLRSLPKFGAFGAMEKCLWSISMKFGDNDNAMWVLLIASPCTTKPQVQSLYHPWLWSPGGLYRNWELMEL